jgi:hypothetical protein
VDWALNRPDLLRLLNRRCSPLSEATTAQIQALPVDELKDLAAWLAANG